MRTHLICYADSNMSISQKLCMKSAKEKGKIDACIGVDDTFIDAEFKQRFSEILNSPQRGGGKGFWLWKPYIVDKYIRQMDDGDILIYCDSGVEWVNDVGFLTALMMKEDIILFSNDHRHINWCKQEVISHMLAIPTGWDYIGQALQHYKQVQASVMLFRVNQNTRNFCARWLAWSCIPGFIDDTIRGVQLPEFREHRNDQSVLTNLQMADRLPLHWWPTQYGHHIRHNYPSDRYPQIFYHHRYRNDDWRRYMGDKAMILNELLLKFMNENKQA